MTIVRMKKRRPPTELEIVGRRLAATRAAVEPEKSQAEFARSMDIGETTWNNWETGYSLPDALKLRPMRERYGITTDWIYFGDPVSLPGFLRDKLLLRAS